MTALKWIRFLPSPAMTDWLVRLTVAVSLIAAPYTDGNGAVYDALLRQ